jgi:hypothetical protein
MDDEVQFSVMVVTVLYRPLGRREVNKNAEIQMSAGRQLRESCEKETRLPHGKSDVADGTKKMR